MLMEDEAGFYRQPTPACAWAHGGHGQPRAQLSCRSNHCVRAAVALNPVCGALHHRMSWSFRAPTMGNFYRLLSQSNPRATSIFLVMDNWPVHAHPKAWRAITDDARMQVLWLPTYAPWLNPAEKVWKYTRQRLTHMHPYAEDLATLKNRIDQTLEAAAADPAAMLRYTGTGNDKLYSS
jgi:hypothetical protein